VTAVALAQRLDEKLLGLEVLHEGEIAYLMRGGERVRW
jgi:hypothetical protein